MAERVLSVECREDMEEDTEEACCVGGSWVEVQEEDGVRWEEVTASVGCF